MRKNMYCVHCGKPLLQVTHIHTLPRYFSSSLSRCRTCGEQRMKRGIKGETKELKQKSTPFEIVRSCTSCFSLLLWETQTDTFTQPWCCDDTGFKAVWVYPRAHMRKYNTLLTTLCLLFFTDYCHINWRFSAESMIKRQPLNTTQSVKQLISCLLDIADFSSLKSTSWTSTTDSDLLLNKYML